MILLNAAQSLAKSVAMNFEPQGLTYELEIDLEAVALTEHQAQSSAERDQKVLVS